MTSTPVQALDLARDLIRCPSVTPLNAGALDVLEDALKRLGFRTWRLPFDDVDNLYARFGTARPNFCFAGHTDVVPVGDEAAWTVAPFAAEIRDGKLIGRGAVDMKSQLGAMVEATSRMLAERPDLPGSISFLITGDEEGPAINGTKKVLAAIADMGETLDHCLVGEPTSETTLGDIIKNGRRGSLNAVVTATGRQGHAAYPDKAANPVPVLVNFLAALDALHFDDGAPGFQPTNLEITTLDVGNPAHNVIPARATAKFNIRFNTHHTGDALTGQLRALAATHQVPGIALDLDIKVTGESFYTPPGRLTDILQTAVQTHTNTTPALTTGGGTSDARFIKDYCPVAELGLKNDTAHQVDEFTEVVEISTLTDIYTDVLRHYFSG